MAILSRRPIEDVVRGLPGEPADEQARYLEATVGDLRVASIYLPNGNPIGTDKFAYKLAWMERLRAHAAALLELDEAVVLGGDYNVIPEPIDCHDPRAWLGDALFQPESRRAFRSLLHLGFTEAFRALHPDERGAYSFWDYQGGAFQLDHGIRIDHLLLSPQAADRLVACTIDKDTAAPAQGVGPHAGDRRAADLTAMRCLLVADLHYDLRKFDWVVAAAAHVDVVVIAGDHLDAAGRARPSLAGPGRPEILPPHPRAGAAAGLLRQPRSRPSRQQGRDEHEMDRLRRATTTCRPTGTPG